MAKLLPDATNPIGGGKINLSIGGVIGMVVGAAVILWVIDLGTTLKNTVKTFIPGNVPFVGYHAPAAAAPVSQGINYGIK